MSCEPKVICSNPTDLHQIYQSDNPDAHCNTIPQRTIGEVWDMVLECKTTREVVAMKIERPYDNWVSWTYEEVFECSKSVSRSLISIGFQPADCINILCGNCPEWAFAAFGAIFVHGIAAGIYTTNQASSVQYIAGHSKCKVAFVDSNAQLEKYLSTETKETSLLAYVMLGKEAPTVSESPSGKRVYTWDEFIQLGKKEEVGDEEFNKLKSSLKPNQCCFLVYTSGTTGNPKAVMISHDNLIYSAEIQKIDFCTHNPSTTHIDQISYLPLSHIAGVIIDVVGPVVNTAIGATFTTVFARPDALKGSLGQTVLEVQPTAFFGVPRIWEKYYEKLVAVVKTIDTGLEAKYGELLNGDVATPRKKAEIEISQARAEMYQKVLHGAGLGKMVVGYSGAAPLAKEISDFFKSLGLVISEAYGMSETSGKGTICNALDRVSTGNVGEVSLGTEMKLHNINPENQEGEICFRGRHVMMGYMYDEAKAKEVIDDDRWMHSGDLGQIETQNGFVKYKISGRIKDLIITAGGENIAPSNIENSLKARLPFLSYAAVIGDKRKYLTVILAVSCVPDPTTGLPTDQLVNPIAGKSTLSEARCDSSDQGMLSQIQNAIVEYNGSEDCVSNAQKLQYFYVSEQDFTGLGSDPQLTATQKLMRRAVNTQFADKIEEMYSSNYDSMKQ